MIPIFIIVKDRLTVLKQSIASYKKFIKTPFEIVLIDNGSTYPEMVKFLKSGEYPVSVNEFIKHNKSNDPGEIRRLSFNIHGIISNYIHNKGIKYYVVTDPDICFHKYTPGDVLEFYQELLNKENVECVAPMLDIHDIPEHYPFKNVVHKVHSKDFWSKKTKKIKYKGSIIEYQYCQHDTTFALYHYNFMFQPSRNAIRVREPYTAKHLDWYIDPNNMPEDQKYYIDNSDKHGGISHWGGHWLAHGLPKKHK
jgi:glycosyltransferase involved in cell wall biosynthesis